MEYTKKLNLKKPGYEDPVDIKDFNDNSDVLDEKISGLVESQERLESRLDSLDLGDSSTPVALVKRVEDLETESERINEEVSVVKDSMESLSQSLETHESETNERISVLDDITGQLNERIGALETREDETASDLVSRVNTIDENLSNLTEDNSEMKSTMESLKTQFSSLEEENAETARVVETVEDNLVDIGLEISSLRDKVSDLESSVDVPLTIDPNDIGLEQDKMTGYVYPTYQGVRSDKGIYIVTGGVGTVFKVRSTTESLAFSVSAGTPVHISYSFSCIDAYDGKPTGNGTASYYVNGSLIMHTPITQGDQSFECSSYLISGNNEVSVIVTDADGETKSLTWNIECIEISVTSTFDYTLAYSGDVTYKYTAYGSVSKTINFILDGVPQETQVVESSGRQNTVVFSGLSHGLHTLDVYASADVNGSYIESNHLLYDVIVVKENSVEPIISINCSTTAVLQGELVDLPYIAHDPLATESNVVLSIHQLVEGKYQLYKQETRTVNRSLQHWTTRDYPVGVVKFTVSLREVTRSVTIEVEENFLPISPATNDLELHLSSANRSNSEVNPAVWSYEGITTTFHNVNWASSGWLADDSGDTALHLASGTSATIGFQPFSEDLRIYGKTLEFEFAVRDVNNRDARVIYCESEGIGIEITADKAKLSSSLSSVECRFNDEKKIRVSFVIESRSEYRLMSVYLNGVLTNAKQYVATDNFQQTNPVNIQIGSPYCSVDLYTVRSYNTALTQEELLNNFICDIYDTVERTTIYDQNDLYDSARNLIYEKVKSKITVMTITGALPASKGDKKTVYVTVEYIDNDGELNVYDLVCTIDVQGTSSQWYVRKNYKLKFKEYITHMLGAIPSKVFCVKADYAEATSTHNTQNANLVHTLYSDKTPAQEIDERCRTTIQGFPIVIYHKETADSTPTFLGKYNYNYDKGSEEVFGFNGDHEVESWEFCNNTSDACNFKDNIPAAYSIIDEAGNEVGWVNDFERRYPDHDGIKEGDEDPEVAISRFRSMHDWVVSTGSYDLSDPEVLSRYRTEFQERFNLHKCLIYYVWTFAALMVDQRAKNMFLTYWAETGKWEPWFYDNDTCFGINNEGHLIFDYYHEDTDIMEDGTKVYNGQDSVLWNPFRIAFAPEIKETWQSLRNDGKISKEILREYFVENGSDHWSASIYNEDSDYKYLSMLRSDGDATNVPQIRGTGEHHLDYYAEGRINFCDSKWYAADYANDFIVLRVNTPTTYGNVAPNANITVTPFSTMYAGVRYRANGTLQQEKVQKNVPHTFIAPSSNFNDTETAIYGASQLSSIGDLSPLYCNYCDVSKAKKLVELTVGNPDPTYESRLTTLSLGTNRLLKRLDIRNCASLTNPVDLTGCPSITEVYAEGSGITGLELADSGYLKIVHLPSTITNLTIKNQNYLEEFSVASYEHIKELNVERSSRVPLLDILLNSPLDRVRLINVEWSCTEEELSTIYNRLLTYGGIDETGINTTKAIVSGIVSVPSISEELLRNINRDFPELMMSVNGTILCTVNYYNYNGTLLYSTTVEKGNSAPDPVAEELIDVPVRPETLDYKYRYRGWSDSLADIQKSKSFVATYDISYAARFYVDDTLLYMEYVDLGESAADPILEGYIDTPTKESTAQYDYTFSHWDTNLDDVTDVRIIRAIFIENIRSYSVSFYSEGVLLQQDTLEYGQMPQYAGKDPTKINVEYPQDYKFLGWSPVVSTVTGEIAYQAVFSESDHIVDSWTTITSHVADGSYKSLYPIGSLKRVRLNYKDGSTELLDFEVVGHDHDDLADGTGKAGLSILCKGVKEETHIMSDSKTLNRASWRDSDMREHLINDILPALPEELIENIVKVIKKTSPGGATMTTEVIDTEDDLWIPALVELIQEYSADPVYRGEGHTYEQMVGSDDQDSRSRRIKLKSNGYASRYWTRSPVTRGNNEYWMISQIGGGIGTYTSYSKQGVAFGFCIGRAPK